MPKTGRSLIGTVAGFKSEWWPVFDPIAGRLHVGIRSDPGEDRKSLRRAGHLNDFDELAPSMGKAEGQSHGGDIALPPAFGQSFIGLVSVHLQHAGKRQQLPRDLASATVSAKV
ncbi:hypothetical protein RGCCGE502_33151 (plasmid) [Rhizobium grahamii CCGE 502]|uniref:Uncharacterized protein n=1 Tax=Rhizobium grahamii CCGE 502 TaxID=990285 RepID=S3H3K1_9HYPH|nr:hypothetical protein RGCCGE502_33151 [Rhizobium grahamii CCGE 502]